MKTTRSAYSLLELLIASSIFAALILAATTTLTSSLSLRDQEQSSYAISNHVDALMRQVTTQLSYATSITPGVLGTDSDWVTATLPAKDGYGRVKTGGSYIVYCTSPSHVFYTFAPASLPSSTPCPQNPANDVNSTGYNVVLTVTPQLDGTVAPQNVSAVKVQITAWGTIGGGTRAGSDASQVTYTETRVVPFNNKVVTHESQ